MDKHHSQSISLLRTALLGAVVLSLLALWRVWQVMKMLAIVSFQLKWVLILVGIGCVALVMAIFFLLTWKEKFCRWVDYILKRVPQSRWAKIIFSAVFVIMITLFTWLFTFSPAKGIFSGFGTITMVWSKGSNYYINLAAVHPIIKFQESIGNNFLSLQSGFFQWWVFGILGLAAALALKIGWKKVTIGVAILGGIIGEAVLYEITRFVPAISTYPFALTWEESHRPYAASLLAAERIYGAHVPLYLSDFSLNLVNGIPFLFGNPSILIYRLWVALLWIGISALICFLLVRRLKIENRLSAWLFAGWVFLYLLQEGGIKYNLLLCVAIILAGFSTRHPWRTLISIILASIWAGLSRVNWYPVPAMLGAALFLLEEPVQNYRTIAHYLIKPALWGIAGFATATVTNVLISWSISGTSGSFGGEQLRSALLWYRLFPNATYPLGILPTVLLVSFPLLLVCFGVPRGRWHSIRIAGLLSLTAVLFGGGLVVSVNIGGGSDLHNMDAYLIMLLIIAAYIFFDRFAVDKQAAGRKPAWWIVALSLIMPVWSTIHIIQPIIPYDHLSINRALQTLKSDVEQAARQGEVLFMYERPLLTFGYIHIPLVPQYETVQMFGPARSGDMLSLDKFYADLRTHRFTLIVTEPQPKGLQDNTYQFGEENNVFYTAIAQPLLCYYELVETIPEANIELYEPRSVIGNCDSIAP